MHAISGFRQGFGAPQSLFTRSFRGWRKLLRLVRKAVHRLHSELADAEVGAFPVFSFVAESDVESAPG